MEAETFKDGLIATEEHLRMTMRKSDASPMKRRGDGEVW
jgi:hypothetical protein